MFPSNLKNLYEAGRNGLFLQSLLLNSGGERIKKLCSVFVSGREM